MGSDTPTIKVEMTDDPLENMKKGGLKQGLKVLVNNQPYMSNNQVCSLVFTTIYCFNLYFIFYIKFTML